jgi:hypothetical protein
MTTKRFPRAWWYRVLIGLLAAFSWCVAVAAFAGRFSALRSQAGNPNLLTVAGWGLSLCAIILVADLLGSSRSSGWHPGL